MAKSGAGAGAVREPGGRASPGLISLLPSCLSFPIWSWDIATKTWAEKSHTATAGVRVRERRHTLPPWQHGFKEETAWTGEGTLEEAGKSWTPSSPAYKISVFISKGTCAEAVGEEKRETKEIGGRGQGESLIQTRKWMLSVEA